MLSQRESKIEDFAYDYLSSYYRKQYLVSDLYVGKQEQTKHGQEVNGLFSLKKNDGAFFAATLSTSHSNKLAALLNNYKKKGLSKLRYITAVVVLAGTAALGYLSGHWALLWIMPLLAAVTGFIIHTLLEVRSLNKELEKAVDAVKKQPANERWLGISISSMSFRNNSLADKLLQICQQKGVGLITVGKRAKVVLLQEPRTSICRKGDYLSHYAAEVRIRKSLTDAFMKVA
ncbi:hypothetical protein [Pontibacter ruber]|uniref:Uncharacterized protein n=1 Tax=Pontibacter ruber TaxID=1343895 RepID=A0ABW5CV17_9BACT|nr:hypothetical protein [Pontibacter ruber]